MRQTQDNRPAHASPEPRLSSVAGDAIRLLAAARHAADPTAVPKSPADGTEGPLEIPYAIRWLVPKGERFAKFDTLNDNDTQLDCYRRFGGIYAVGSPPRRGGSWWCPIPSCSTRSPVTRSSVMTERLVAVGGGAGSPGTRR